MASLVKLVLIVVTLAVVLPLPAVAQRDKERQTLQQINARIEQFSHAFVAADATVLASLLTEGYRHTNNNGSVLNKRQWLDYIASRQAELASGKLKIDAYLNQDMQISLYGDTAVVTGRNLSKGSRDGRPFELQLRFTHVWVRQKGQWLRAAFHDSIVSQP